MAISVTVSDSRVSSLDNAASEQPHQIAMVPKSKRQKTEAAEAEAEAEGSGSGSAILKVEEDTGTSQPKRKLRAQVTVSNPERVKSTHLVGAHISAAGGVENSVGNALKIGANCFSVS